MLQESKFSLVRENIFKFENIGNEMQSNVRFYTILNLDMNIDTVVNT